MHLPTPAMRPWTRTVQGSSAGSSASMLPAAAERARQVPGGELGWRPVPPAPRGVFDLPPLRVQSVLRPYGRVCRKAEFAPAMRSRRRVAFEVA